MRIGAWGDPAHSSSGGPPVHAAEFPASPRGVRKEHYSDTYQQFMKSFPQLTITRLMMSLKAVHQPGGPCHFS